MSQIPSIVVVSSSSTKPKSLIRLITGNSGDDELEESDCISKKWHIDTKYYSAEVNFIGITEDYVRTEEFNDNVEALIIHMDSNKSTGLEDLKKWETLENDCNPEVKLLISNYFAVETKITQNRATEWCLKRGYELVELYPNKATTEESEQIIAEKTGVDRIVEALQAHMWPNLIMKGENTMKMATNKSAKEELDDGIDEFADLFQQLHTMKGSIESMPMQQRRQCAEQMVTAFWRAIGGEEDEIADL